jgi:hypothetical protein
MPAIFADSYGGLTQADLGYQAQRQQALAQAMSHFLTGMDQGRRAREFEAQQEAEGARLGQQQRQFEEAQQAGGQRFRQTYALQQQEAGEQARYRRQQALLQQKQLDLYEQELAAGGGPNARLTLAQEAQMHEMARNGGFESREQLDKLFPGVSPAQRDFAWQTQQVALPALEAKAKYASDFVDLINHRRKLRADIAKAKDVVDSYSPFVGDMKSSERDQWLARQKALQAELDSLPNTALAETGEDKFHAGLGHPDITGNWVSDVAFPRGSKFAQSNRQLQPPLPAPEPTTPTAAPKRQLAVPGAWDEEGSEQDTQSGQPVLPPQLPPGGQAQSPYLRLAPTFPAPDIRSARGVEESIPAKAKIRVRMNDGAIYMIDNDPGKIAAVKARGGVLLDMPQPEPDLSAPQYWPSAGRQLQPF